MPDPLRRSLSIVSDVMMALRPRLRRVLPRQLHYWAGVGARSALRLLERHAASGPRGAPAPPLQRAERAVADASGPVLHVNASLRLGGTERQIVNTLLGLQDRLDRPVHLLCQYLGESADSDVFRPALAGFRGEVRNLMPIAAARAALDRHGHGQWSAGLVTWLASMPRDVRVDAVRVAGEIASLRPAVVHGWQDGIGPLAAIVARALGVPRVIVATRNLNPSRFGYFRPYMRSILATVAADPGIVMLANSAAGARDYASWLGCDAGRFAVLRNGISEASAERPSPDRIAALRRELALPVGVPVVGGLMRLERQKRPELWIEAAAATLRQRPETHFVVFGTGPMEGQVRSLAARLGVASQLHLAGLAGNAGLALSVMDVLLLTSSAEGTPNVALEAGLAGVPVVATDAGGTAETMLAGQTGLLVPGGSDAGQRAALPAAIAEALLRALGDAAWRAEARRLAPAFVRETYGMGRMLDEVVALYRTDGAGT